MMAIAAEKSKEEANSTGKSSALGVAVGTCHVSGGRRTITISNCCLLRANELISF